jgi:acyl transferase domain-containing protein
MMNEKQQHLSENTTEQIAVIGMAGMFPGANSVEQFWQNLCGGVESITQFTNHDLKRLGVPDDWLQDPKFVKAGTQIEHFDAFDAAFFGYTPREALLMDPQQRLFLEQSWKAIENAGYNPEGYEGPIGVFAGTSPDSYRALLPSVDYNDTVGRMELMIGSQLDFVATRVSYKLNLKGPSLTVQTACSTSLTAIQLASQSLLSYQCDMALAGGASLSFGPHFGYFYQEGAILSSDGHCRAFDSRATGTVLGQGVGVVVLKRLSEALADGDTIYAVIKGCGINNDGAGKIGYTAPSVRGQAEAIALAHVLSGVSADSITYVEAHGTGTKLGDPIEIAALTKAFRASTSKRAFCAIGSVKTNIGHADHAAGIAGFIKTVLMLLHKKIPPSLHFENPNPEIDFENSPFYVATHLADWKTNAYPRRFNCPSNEIPSEPNGSAE